RKRRRTADAVAVEVLVHDRFERFQRSEERRVGKECKSELVAVDLENKHRVLIGVQVLPDNVVSAASLLSPDRGPGAELTRRNRRTEILQLGTRPAADAVEKVVGAHLTRACGSDWLYPGRRKRRRTADAVAVEVLVHDRFERFQ